MQHWEDITLGSVWIPEPFDFFPDFLRGNRGIFRSKQVKTHAMYRFLIREVGLCVLHGPVISEGNEKDEDDV